MNKQAATGQLWVIAAPSGAGKTSLVDALLQQVDQLMVSISYTTRTPRTKEEHGQHYHFVDNKTFESMISVGDLLEYANVFGHYYGTGRSWVEQQLANGQDVILEIDWQGATQIKQLMPASKSIFILPPSLQTLAERIHGRGQDDSGVIQQRLAEASQEMSHCGEFDYIIINDKFEHALMELMMIIKAQRLISRYQVIRYSHLLKDLQQ